MFVPHQPVCTPAKPPKAHPAMPATINIAVVFHFTPQREFIKDKISALDWEELQELVAGILRAMGKICLPKAVVVLQQKE
jgi:hypothetical protein